MSTPIPALRHEINVNVQSENGETYLVLYDPFGFTDGPIMVHSDMIDILEICDGTTTYEDLAVASQLEPDSKEMLKVRAFVAQLDDLGFLDSEKFEARRELIMDKWTQSTTRPAVCAGTTYPSDPEQLRDTLSQMLDKNVDAETSSSDVVAALIPHIDYRVTDNAYGPGFNSVRNSDADLFIIIGTSHYWQDDRVILTEKDFETPLGTVETDKGLVHALSSIFKQETDLAHKPEHSIELHAVFLKYIFSDRPFTILPILVSGYDDSEGPAFHDEMRRIGAIVADAVQSSNRKAMWLISGDLSHVGKKFGDDLAAAILETDVADFDRALLDSLEATSRQTFHEHIAESENRFRVCGHAPALLALEALSNLYPNLRGNVVAYERWHETETQSMVSFASVLFRS